MVDESKTWACGLPIVPDCDRASEAGGPPVTVGVEWEFLVDPSTGPYGPFIKLPGDEHFVPSVSRPDSLHNQLHLYHLSKALNDAGILAATGPEVKYALEKPGYAKARFPHVDHGLPLCERFKDYFVISVDASVVDDGMKMPNEKWASVEVASPVMTISELHKIDAAFGLLLEAFRLKTNMSYGLHVHVGNANRGFSPEWMRTVGAMCWAIAPLFDAFHPPSRGPCHGYSRGMRWFAKAAHDGKTLSASGYDDDPANSPVSFMFPTAPGCTVAYPIPPVWPGRPEIAYGRGPQAADPEARPLPSEQRIPANIEKVLLRDGKCPKCPADHHMAWCGVKRLLESKSAFDTLDMLKNACGSGGRMTYNFNNLRRQGHDDTNKPRTIEFRQHDGTMDLVAIKCWMRVCCSIVELCRPLRDPRGNGLMNSPHAVEVAHRAVEGTLCITKYDVYDFMADIGSKVAYQTYLRQRKDESDAVGLLIAGPEDDLPEENEHQHALGHLAALQPLVATLTNAA
ncbi:hypothetical protein SCUCBS95973_003136 [Sporothrix curviconia]|uniref:Amidoligase enzyme n=1 Tax=Sporothrix curviconia TaxID=1260050 RepID=A0ABP0BD41_9PEZI